MRLQRRVVWCRPFGVLYANNNRWTILVLRLVRSHCHRAVKNSSGTDAHVARAPYFT
jgi:hypothetical protein